MILRTVKPEISEAANETACSHFRSPDAVDRASVHPRDAPPAARRGAATEERHVVRAPRCACAPPRRALTRSTSIACTCAARCASTPSPCSASCARWSTPTWRPLDGHIVERLKLDFGHIGQLDCDGQDGAALGQFDAEAQPLSVARSRTWRRCRRCHGGDGGKDTAHGSGRSAGGSGGGGRRVGVTAFPRLWQSTLLAKRQLGCDCGAPAAPFTPGIPRQLAPAAALLTLRAALAQH